MVQGLQALYTFKLPSLCNLFFIFYIVCSICTDPGLVPNSDCNGCVVTDICLADNPCTNGNCTLNSAPNDYTCDCAPGFTGTNCTSKCYSNEMH